jgi:TrmH family RNA methyltransferase
MVSKNEFKYIQSLFDKKNRDAEGLFIAETPKLVEELLDSEFVIKKIYATIEWIQASKVDLNIVEVTLPELERMSGLQTPNKVLAIVNQKRKVIQPSFGEKITLMLDGIQDPGNLGTIIRIADWFGIDTIVASEDTADMYNPKVVQATMGSITRVDLFYGQLDEWLLQGAAPVYGAVLNGQSIYEAVKIKEGIIIIGNESKGIRQNIFPFITNAITIPKFGEAESLNAAVATGIIVSHLVCH